MRAVHGVRLSRGGWACFPIIVMFNGLIMPLSNLLLLVLVLLLLP
jgi:hypothetical protein